MKKTMEAPMTTLMGGTEGRGQVGETESMLQPIDRVLCLAPLMLIPMAVEKKNNEELTTRFTQFPTEWVTGVRRDRSEYEVST